jgi:predicted nucleic-acid-binding Zn-ribbon protein
MSRVRWRNGKGKSHNRIFDFAVRFTKKWDWKGDMIIPFYCKNCGYIKLYKEMKEKKE